VAFFDREVFAKMCILVYFFGDDDVCFTGSGGGCRAINWHFTDSSGTCIAINWCFTGSSDTCIAINCCSPIQVSVLPVINCCSPIQVSVLTVIINKKNNILVDCFMQQSEDI
jgi:hypothetical protein